MNIKKIGHCCLIIEINGVIILTDPGFFTAGSNVANDLDVILITHEHGDHLHIDSVKALLTENPEARVITNAGVGVLLAKESIPFEVVGDGESVTIKGILIEGMGKEHAIIYGDRPPIENTGYFINEKLFYPGDAFYDPKRPVDILALPVCGPWMKLGEAIDYAAVLLPRVVFPVHDWLYRPELTKMMETWVDTVMRAKGIEFVSLQAGESQEF